MNKGDLPTACKNLKATTAAVGANWTAWGDSACLFARIHNPNSVNVDVRRGSSGDVVTIPAASVRTFFGIGNLSDLQVRRTDQSNTQVDVQAEALA